MWAATAAAAALRAARCVGAGSSRARIVGLGAERALDSTATVPPAAHYSSSSTEEEEPPPRDVMPYDVCIVGAGPAGLAAAIRAKQLAPDMSVCLLEKGAEVGAHVISGNVFDPRALDELIPDWRAMDEAEGPPIRQEVTRDASYFLTSGGGAWSLPTPPTMQNEGKAYVVSLSALARWLGAHAEEALGVDIFPGFPASEVLRDPVTGAVCGVATQDAGIALDGSRKPTYERGVAIRASCTILAEGCRGSLSERITADLGLRAKAGAQAQTYALGLKEVWEISEEAQQHFKPGEVWHTVGFPLDAQTYGGGFLYGMGDDRRVSIGLVVGLDYQDPFLSPYDEFQRMKHHPKIAQILRGGTCLQYGARTLVEGGWQSLPFAGFEGGCLVGCAAGTLNAPRIKGAHTAMKSGMVAAEVAVDALRGLAPCNDEEPPAVVDLTAYDAALRSSWVGEELYSARNFRPAFGMGMFAGMAHAALDAFVLGGRAPYTLRHAGEGDNTRLGRASDYAPRVYSRPDGEVSFDKATSLHRSGTNHEHDQPKHLCVRNAADMAATNLPLFAGPEQRYCPAGVYEYVEAEAGGEEGGKEGGAKRLQINAQNCLHCKACDIKDPHRNIEWTVPEGGGGPAYTLM